MRGIRQLAKRLLSLLPRLAGRQPSEVPGEPKYRVFVSSVMRTQYQSFRDEVVRALDGMDGVDRWAFEYTPAASEPADASYLRHVREADAVIWLVTAETTPAVCDEVHEALAKRRRLLVFVTTETSTLDAPTATLLERVGQSVKWTTVTEHGDLGPALQRAWRDEVARAMREPPGIGRKAILTGMLSESRGRAFARWRAVGVSSALATQLAEDASVGAGPAYAAPSKARPLVLLLGEYGSGKSLFAERVFQAEVAQALIRYGPVPVFLRAQAVQGGLRESVLSASTDLGDPRTCGTYLIVDGLDEAGVAQADSILKQARTLVHAWPETRVLITSRALPNSIPSDDSTTMPLLGPTQSLELVSRVMGREVTLSEQHSLPTSIAEAIRRPLYAVLLGGFLAEGSNHFPRSPAELMSTLVERALSPIDLDSKLATGILERLAVETVRCGGGALPASTVGNAQSIQALAGTGLLAVNATGTVSFPLPLLAQWFAAQSLASGRVDEVCGRAPDLDLWRYPFVIAVGRFDQVTVHRILSWIVQVDPGLAAQVIAEGVAPCGMDETVDAPPSLDAATQLRDSMQAWIDSIGPLAQLVAPMRPDGTQLPTGARRDGAMLLAGWYDGQDATSTVFAMPPHEGIFSARAGWVSLSSARPGRQAGWAWQWTLDAMQSRMRDWLEDRPVPSRQAGMHSEDIWAKSLLLLGSGPLRDDPIPLNLLQEKIDFLGSAGRLQTRGGPVDLELLSSAMQRVRDAGGSAIECPHPGQDQTCPTPRWIWDGYSEAQLMRRIESVLTMALELYCAYVDDVFVSLKPRLRTAVLLPAVLECALHPPRSDSAMAGPSWSWRFRALPRGSHSQVSVTSSPVPRPREETDWVSEMAELRRLRPHAAAWISYTRVRGELGVFGATPAKDLALRWLSDDLLEISWLDRHVILPS